MLKMAGQPRKVKKGRYIYIHNVHEKRLESILSTFIPFPHKRADNRSR